MNPTQLYLGNEYQYRLIEFLNEGMKLDDFRNLDYNTAELQSERHGFYNASKEAIRKALNYQMITESDLIQWHQWMTNEVERHQAIPHLGKAISSENKMKLFAFVQDLKRSLPHPGNAVSDLKRVEIIADHFRSFVKLELFEKGNLLMALLIANYIATWCRIPLFVFRSNEKSALNEAIQDLTHARLYFAHKRREAIFDGCRLMLKDYEDPLNTTYKDSMGKKVTIHWNEFVLGQKAWEKS